MPGPMTEDRATCDLIRASMSLNLGPSLPDGYSVSGSSCVEWLIGEVA